MRRGGQPTTKIGAPLYFQWKYDTAFKKENISLYKTEAMRRSELVKDVKYHLFLSYGLKEEFRGALTTKFHLNTTDFDPKELFLDFQGKAIAGVKVNGTHAE